MSDFSSTVPYRRDNVLQNEIYIVSVRNYSKAKRNENLLHYIDNKYSPHHRRLHLSTDGHHRQQCLDCRRPVVGLRHLGPSPHVDGGNPQRSADPPHKRRFLRWSVVRKSAPSVTVTVTRVFILFVELLPTRDLSWLLSVPDPFPTVSTVWPSTE